MWGPSPIASFTGFTYYMLLIDDYTRYSWLIPLKLKSDAYQRISEFKTFVLNQFKSNIKTFRSDCGGQFLNKLMTNMFREFGIINETSCPYTPQQNGLVERKHAHIVETTITLLQQSKMPIKFWLEAMNASMYLLNILPHSSLRFHTPYESLYQQSFDYLQLRTFGCSCFPYLRHYNDNKLQPRSKLCVFIGYSPGTKGYRCLDPTDNKVYLSRHVRFIEHEFPYNYIKIGRAHV